MTSLLLFVSVIFGLIKFQGISIRTISISGLILSGFYKVKSSYFNYVNMVLVIVFFIFYSCLYTINVIQFNNMFLLHSRNLIVLIVLFGMLSQNKLDFQRLLSITSVFIVICSLLNILVIIFFSKPWILIALYTGTEEANFTHLYNRLILPFGTPNQLGFVAGLLLLYNMAIKKIAISLLLLIPLLGAASNSSLVPLFLILFCFIVFQLIHYKKIRLKINSILIVIFLIISLLSILFFLSDTTVMGGVGGRSSENMHESMGRHLLLRLNTLYSLSDFTFLQYFYGVGLGNSNEFVGGTYSFTVPLTILFESGFFGLYVYYIIPFLFILKYKQSSYVLIIIFYVFSASILYQLNNDISYYLLPLVIAYQLHRKNNENNLSL